MHHVCATDGSANLPPPHSAKQFHVSLLRVMVAGVKYSDAAIVSEASILVALMTPLHGVSRSRNHSGNGATTAHYRLHWSHCKVSKKSKLQHPLVYLTENFCLNIDSQIQGEVSLTRPQLPLVSSWRTSFG